MKIVMLLGKSGCGKTTTLNKVYNYINPNKEDIIKPKSKLGGEKKDFECIIRYNGKNIAFYTMGDYSKKLVTAMNNYQSECDFLICACNSKFKKPKAHIKKFNHIIIDKKISTSSKKNDRKFANNYDKDKIINELN